jgi:large subunit ribosomal protein L25
MKTLELKARRRGEVGKRASRLVRNSGRVPGAVHHDGNAFNIDLEYLPVQRLLHSADTFLVNLDIEGEVKTAIVREAQFHPVTDRILHIDFVEVVPGKKVILTLPLVLVGTPVGVSKGGKLQVKLRKIKVKGIPVNLPAEVPIDVSGIDLGGTIKVGELQIEGLEIITSASASVASVEIPRALRGQK